MGWQRMRLMLALAVSAASLLTGCVGTSLPADVSTLSDVVGPDLPGAQGLTLDDQEKIDSAMAGLCAGDVYDGKACDLHSKASNERRKQLLFERNHNVAS